MWKNDFHQQTACEAPICWSKVNNRCFIVCDINLIRQAMDNFVTGLHFISRTGVKTGLEGCGLQLEQKYLFITIDPFYGMVTIGLFFSPLLALSMICCIKSQRFSFSLSFQGKHNLHKQDLFSTIFLTRAHHKLLLLQFFSSVH